MAKSIPEAVLDWLKQNPGCRAREIAEGLSLDRKAVSQALYGPLKLSVWQDADFRWWPIGSQKPAETTVQPLLPVTKLAQLARYFREAIARDIRFSISVFASSKFDDLDYGELSVLPALVDNPPQPDEALRRLLEKAARQLKNYTLVIGYPILMRRGISRHGAHYRKLEPLFVLPLDSDAESAERLSFNHECLTHFAAGGASAAIEEARSLADALGLLTAEGDPPGLEDVLFRLPEVRPDWPWLERIDPFALRRDPPLSRIEVEGFLNRAAVFLIEAPRFTAGLEAELTQLERFTDSAKTPNALSAWVSGRLTTPKRETGDLIEVAPLNLEQREAVRRALRDSLTVITGPPGTGKSQVVTALIVNAVKDGQTVLFASRNNKAVDVVEERVNGLADRPVMVRIGSKKEFAAKLVEQFAKLLASPSMPDMAARLASLERRMHAVIEAEADIRLAEERLRTARNRTVELESAAEALRRVLGGGSLYAARDFPRDATGLVDCLRQAWLRADRSRQTALLRLLWPFIRSGREAALREALARVRPIAETLRIPLEDDALSSDVLDELAQRAALIRPALDYLAAAEALAALPTDAALARRLAELAQEREEVAGPLWQLWLASRAATMTSKETIAAKGFVNQLKMALADSPDDASPKIDWRAMVQSLGRVVPCWAVTALSARGRVPFSPGAFDLVIIDEASQCDIASALPLLFRAKRAVVLGDPMQLSHITQLSPGEDRRLLERHGLAGDMAHWSYTQSSLFDLAAALAGPGAVVTLRDHHRSHPEIIEFSNRHFYGQSLRVATRYDRLRLPPRDRQVLRWIDASGPVRRPAMGGAVQEDVARATVEAVRDLLVERNYQGTVGVVTPFLRQVHRLRELIDADRDLQARKMQAELHVDTAHGFQGDERDVIFFSLVCGPGMTEGSLGFLRSNGNLFNVAVTRARASLVVVGDRTAAARSGVPYLQAFVAYFDEVAQASPAVALTAASLGPDYPDFPAGNPPVSEEERILYRALYAVGLRPVPQYPVEAYRLDLALLHGERKLDIEVDGRRHHQQSWDGERLRRDQIRNQRLIELGWDVQRFWGSQVREDLDACVAAVLEWSRRNPPLRPPAGTTDLAHQPS